MAAPERDSRERLRRYHRGRSFSEEPCQLANRHRRAIEEALDVGTAEIANPLELLLGFDALGRRCHAEIVGKARDRMNDGVRLRIVTEPLDEAAVDLDLVEGEAAQIAQDE